ncbi:MAG: type II secretion system F family protein [Clostridiaceae bacterium]|mgnify:CR=1 FL=1|jgi:type IV pilus assembly protein PilC|nr:type II secretion system F family protein [Clostridiaceae bacterium]
MASFSYECLNRQGQTVKGQISSENIPQAVDKLRSMGLSIVELKEIKIKKKSSFLSMEKKVTLGDLTLFSRQLSAMISSGIPVTRAINTLSRQSENPALRSALENIARNVEGGMNLTDAFSAYPHIFSDLYVSMIRAGEAGGMLENSLLRLSEQLQKEKILKDEVKSAISYPRTIGIFALLIFIAMLVFLVPIFQGSLPQHVEINVITQFIFDMSASIRSNYLMWIFAAIAIVAVFTFFFKSRAGHDFWERIKLKMPVFGPIILKSVIARFTRTLATLMEGGIPVVQALESAGPTSGSDVLNEAVQLATKRIEEGKSIASTLEESDVFPPMVTHMISVGEESGSLPSLLDKVAEFYEQEVAATTRGLQALIQPIALIVIGILIGGMLIALYSPIFSAVTSSGG